MGYAVQKAESPVRRKKQGRQSTPMRGANDNRKRLPYNGPGDKPTRPFGTRGTIQPVSPGRLASGSLLKSMARKLPYIGIAYTIWEIGNWAMSPKQEQGWKAHPGFSDFHDCPTNPPYNNGTFVKGSSSLAASISNVIKCLPQQAMVSPPNSTSNLIIAGPVNNAGTHFFNDVIWLYPRAMPRPIPLPQFIPAANPRPISPPYLPELPFMPEYLPINKPVPIPFAPPYRDIPLQPKDHPIHGPVRGPAPFPGARPRPRPDGRPRPPRPYEEPVDELEINPDDPPGTKPVPKPQYHQNRPPHKGEKEKKQIFNLKRDSPLDWLAQLVTESTDFINAFYKALPWKMRRFKGRDGRWRDKDITPQDRLRRVYKHWDDLGIDYWADVQQELRENSTEDHIFGKIGSALAENVPNPRGVGWQTGLAL